LLFIGISVLLEAPALLAPNDSSVLSATVYNQGSSDETNVMLQLLINNTIINSTVISTLLSDSAFVMNYSWNPSAEGAFNITAYAQPTPGEGNILDNAISRIAIVRPPLITPIEGQYANYVASVREPDQPTQQVAFCNITYLQYVRPRVINITSSVEYPNFTSTSWFLVNTMNRAIEEPTYGVTTFYPLWFETDVSINSSIQVENTNGTVVGSETIHAGSWFIDCWKLSISSYGATEHLWFDKFSGLTILVEYVYGSQIADYLLVDTNVRVGNTTTFITMCYRDLHFRDPEPTGLAYWAGELESGTLTKAGYVDVIFNSDEYLGNWQNKLFVALMYDNLLQRFPDQTGYDVWTGLLDSTSLTREQMLQLWLASEEWNSRFGSYNNTEFVNKLYRDMLHREPDQLGLEYWIGVLGNGALTRAEVILAFCDCPEYGTANSEQKLTYQLYIGLLGRMPDSEGYAYWVNQLQTGTPRENVIDAFLSCPEYATKHSMQW
jgi:hypothetical protein